MHKKACRKLKEFSRGYIAHKDGPKIQTQACLAQVSAASRTPSFTRPLAKQPHILCDRADIHTAFSHLADHCRWYRCNLPLGNWNLIFGAGGHAEVLKSRKHKVKWEVLTSKMAQFVSTKLRYCVHHHQWKDSVPLNPKECPKEQFFLWLLPLSI